MKYKMQDLFQLSSEKNFSELILVLKKWKIFILAKLFYSAVLFLLPDGCLFSCEMARYLSHVEAWVTLGSANKRSV